MFYIGIGVFKGALRDLAQSIDLTRFTGEVIGGVPIYPTTLPQAGFLERRFTIPDEIERRSRYRFNRPLRDIAKEAGLKQIPL